MCLLERCTPRARRRIHLSTCRRKNEQRVVTPRCPLSLAPRDEAESDVTQSASLWSVSTGASFLWGKGVVTAFRAAFDALGNGLWTRGRREERKPVWGLKSWDNMSYEYCFFMLFMTILLSLKGQSFPLSCSSIIKVMVRKYLNEKLLIPFFFPYW